VTLEGSGSIHDHVVPFDGGELDGELPVAQTDHGVDQPMGDRLFAFDSAPSCIYVHRFIGVKAAKAPKASGSSPASIRRRSS